MSLPRNPRLDWKALLPVIAVWISLLSLMVGPGHALAVSLLLLAALPLGVKLAFLAGPLTAAAPTDRPGSSGEPPFISIHIATHDEPPGVVLHTLESLARLDYPAARHEVVVLDNNTPDPARWKPLADWCARRGGRFHFHHDTGVTGAKAGALNLGLQRTDPRAEWICSVDADYAVEPTYLRRAAEIIATRPGLSHLQFPQAYRNVSPCNAGASAELGQYFDAYALRSAGTESMLLTGTLCVVRRDALEKAGGWPVDTITEDAHLGLMLLKGGRGLFIDEVQGRGLMPESLEVLGGQRQRWAAGNAQVLRKVLAGSSAWPGLSVLAQLAAWLCGACLLLPGIALAAVIPAFHPQLPWLAAGFSLLVLAEALLVCATAKGSLRLRGQAAVARLALLPEAAIGLVQGLAGRKLAFVRTPKDRPRRNSGRVRPLSWVLAFAAALFLVHGDASIALVSGTLWLVATARGWLARSLAAGEKRGTRPRPEVLLTPIRR
ncbi:glycosyltransferase family 2 protein [Haloferula sargassicola]|uniref:Glycosyltransferase 2-like domain-containing protein n=1 Tax=Haloferula sargassicola TaxID=490096 RepID=A0ABP9UNH7_9BACT